jgi:signal transduction histidine kinase
MKRYSLTRRLIATVLLIELASALCVTTAAFFYERHVHFRSFDIRLRGRADSILGAVQDSEDATDDVMLDGTESSSPSEDIYQVVDDKGRLLGRSPNWSGPHDLVMESHGRHHEGPHDTNRADAEAYASARIGDDLFRVIRLNGTRVVDPGDANGGTRRNVTVYYGSPMNRVWGAVVNDVIFYAVSSILVLASTGLLMFWLLNRGLAPLRGLALAAGKVSASTWEFSPPEDARQTAELAPLVSALESLLAGLEQSFERQRRFVGDAAHELKTGVALVKSSLQLLSMKPRTRDEYIAGLERCLVDCLRMEEMVMQMLTIARVEEEPVAAREGQASELIGSIQAVVQQLEPITESNRVLMQFIVAETGNSLTGPMRVPVKPEDLRLLFSNVLVNAIQHSPPGSTIDVHIASMHGHAHVTITDQGDGIEPADLPFVFERFSRGDPSRSRNTGGAGLGLAICKAIVNRASGSIELSSVRGSGTTVTIGLPLAVDPKSAETVRFKS